MTVADAIAKTTSALPPDKQREVLDFAEFLAQRSNGVPHAKLPSVEEVKQGLAAAAGIWKDRTDLPQDSAQAAQMLRERAMDRGDA